MPTPREVIAKLRKKGDMDIGDGVILPLDWPANNWVQYRKREHVGSGNDEVYYEVQNRNNKLVAQLHYKCSEGADSEMLRQLLEKAKDLNFYGYERYRHREMGYLFSCRKPINVADYDVDMILDKLRADIKILYDAFEGIIAKHDSQCPAAINSVQSVTKRSNNKKHGDKWVSRTVVFKPVVGRGYESNGLKRLGRRVMVLGASHYCEHFDPNKGCSPACAMHGRYYVEAGGRELFYGIDCERFTEVVYERYRNRLKMTDRRKNNWFRTFSRFFNAFYEGGNPSDKERWLLLDHLVCAEYVQGAEAQDCNGKSLEAMASQRNFDELVENVKNLKPDVIVIWGRRVWSEICRRTGNDGRLADSLDIIIGGRAVKLLNIPHPSSSRFDANAFRQLLKDSGVSLLSTKVDERK